MRYPTPILPDDIRPGDKVRLTREIEVAEVADGWITDRLGRFYTKGFEWTLLDRPEPPREVGSRWRDPESGAEYVKTDGQSIALYVRYKIGHGLSLPTVDVAKTVIARLVPVEIEAGNK